MAKILIVDDSEITLTELKNILESEGHDVITANNGKDAMDKFASSAGIQLIFTDINMPIMNGIEMCAGLQQKYEKVPPILAITTEVNKDIKAEAKKLGVVAWLVKPFDAESLPGITKQLIDLYSK